MRRSLPIFPKLPDRRRLGGFTLLEAAVVTMIVGLGVVALLELLAAGTFNNAQSAELTTAVNLARNVREMSLEKSFAGVQGLQAARWSPPIDSRSQPVADLSGWAQSVSVQAISPDNLTLNIVDANPSAVCVTVSVTHNGRSIYTLSWLRFAPMS